MRNFLNVKVYSDHIFTMFKSCRLRGNANCSEEIYRNICVCKECDVFSGMVLLLVHCSLAKVTVDTQSQVLEKRGQKMIEYSMQLVRRMNCRRILGKQVILNWRKLEHSLPQDRV